MAYKIAFENGTIQFALVGKVRIQDTIAMCSELRLVCEATSRVHIDARECTSAEFGVLQLIYSTKMSVQDLRIGSYSEEFMSCVESSGLRSKLFALDTDPRNGVVVGSGSVR